MKERVFRFRAIEQRIAASRPGFRVCDIGCGRGDNLRRLVRYGGKPIGIEPSLARARQANTIAPAVTAVGEHVPLAFGQSIERVPVAVRLDADQCFDDLRALQRHLFDRVIRHRCRYVDSIPDFAIDLNHESQFLLRECGPVDRRPRLINDRTLMTQSLP